MSPAVSVDPLAEVVTLLQPAARFSKLVDCASPWRIHRDGTGEPFYCAILDGQCRLTVAGQSGMTLQAGDFVLIPDMRDLVIESPDAGPSQALTEPVPIGDGHFRVGRQDGPADLRMRIGHCSFEAPDSALLVSLLPRVVLARGEPRLVTLMQLVGDETRATRPARDLVLQRLLEVLLIEALRCGTGPDTAPGIARGLADARVAAALRAMHHDPAQGWTVPALAREAALSRSAFFARFTRTVGVPPMEYLQAWRMALAKRLLRARELAMDEVAARVGYSSASTFSTAFARHAGMPPARFARSSPVNGDAAP